MAIEISGTIIKAEVDGNFLVLDVDGDTTTQVPFIARFTTIADWSDTHVILEDGSKIRSEAWQIPLANYYQADGTTAIDTKATIVAYLKDKIG